MNSYPRNFRAERRSACGASDGFVTDFGRAHSVFFTDPDGLYQGDRFSLNKSAVEIQIVRVVDGNYGVKKIK